MSDPERIASFLLKPVRRACKEFDLLADGDRIAVAVSGGKDSRTLLDLLQRYRRQVPISYELVAVHIVGTPANLPDLTPQLEPWFKESGVEYHFAPLELAPDETLPLGCFRCSWNRRKTLFITAERLGCNKLAFGHHADDAAVTTLMNLMFTGKLETMEPKITFFDDRITVIRPLIYALAKELARYARAREFPSPPSCPHEPNSQRYPVEQFLRQFGRRQTQIRANLWRAARQGIERGDPD